MTKHDHKMAMTHTLSKLNIKNTFLSLLIYRNFPLISKILSSSKNESPY